MVRDQIVNLLAKSGHDGMERIVRRMAVLAQTGQIEQASTGTEVVSALFRMCAQGIEVGLKIGCTRESLRHAILGLYMLVADEQTKQ